MIRIAKRKTNGRLVQVLRKKDNELRVRQLNNQKAEWVKESEVVTLQKPEPGIYMRMTKPTKFDQECGCTAVAEFRINGEVEMFNVYGDLDKYLKSDIREGLNKTPHYSRMFLKEHGFVRSRGLPSKKVKGDAKFKKMRECERKGYEVKA